MFPTLFTIGDFPVHSYGVLIATGFLLCVWLSKREAIRLGLPADKIVDLGFYSLLVGLVGARLLYIITLLSDYLNSPAEMFKFWEGGLVFYGGILACIPLFFWYTKKFNLPRWTILDIGATAVPFAHAFGRMGCLSSGCCYGRPTGGHWGIKLYSPLVDPALQGVYLHPTQIYEAVSLFVLWYCLRRRRLHKKFEGELFYLYFIAYSAIRFVIEFFRGDNIRGFIFDTPISTSQFIAFFVFFIMSALYLRKRKSLAKLAVAALSLFLLSGFTDFRGKAFDTFKTPPKVAALTPSLAEILISLGKSKQLIAAPDFTNFTEFSGEKKPERLGPYNKISVEKVYSLKPELVLASMDGNEEKTVTQLEQMGLRVLTVNTLTLHDIVKSTQMIASTFNAGSNPKVLELEKKLAAPDAKPARRQKVFVQISSAPLMSINKHTFINELITKAGGTNILADAKVKYPRTNAEEVLSKNPDIIIICDVTNNPGVAKQSAHYWEQFKNLKAKTDHKIYIVPADWLTKPGFNLIKGLNELKKILADN